MDIWNVNIGLVDFRIRVLSYKIFLNILKNRFKISKIKRGNYNDG